MKNKLHEYEEKFTENEKINKELKETLSQIEKEQSDAENHYVSLLRWSALV